MSWQGPASPPPPTNPIDVCPGGGAGLSWQRPAPPPAPPSQPALSGGGGGRGCPGRGRLPRPPHLARALQLRLRLRRVHLSSLSRPWHGCRDGLLLAASPLRPWPCSGRGGRLRSQMMCRVCGGAPAVLPALRVRCAAAGCGMRGRWSSPRCVRCALGWLVGFPRGWGVG